VAQELDAGCPEDALLYIEAGEELQEVDVMFLPFLLATSMSFMNSKDPTGVIITVFLISSGYMGI
jgi:hypothetical protein